MTKVHRSWFEALMMVGANMASAGAEPPTVERFDLPNGVRVIAIHMPGAARQATFTFLPLSLAADRVGEAQWSHLIEHMLIRSTDPLTLSPPGMLINGETMADSMRLETIAEPDAWRASIDRHAAWLAARDFHEETLEREKLAIAGEEAGTAMNRATHKWAIAAWNQAIRHGAKHVELHGNVATADVDRVEAAAAAVVPIDASVLVVSFGPAPANEVRALIEQSIGTIPSDPPDRAAPIVGAQFAGAHEATWDLPTRHLLLWWRLPQDTPAVRAFARAVAPAIALQISRAPREWRGRVSGFVAPFVLGPGDSLVILASVSAPPDLAAAEVIRFAVGRVHDLLDAPDRMASIARSTSASFAAWPDLDRLRATAPGNQSTTLVANLLLPTMIAEYTIGARRDEIHDILAAPEPGMCRTLMAALRDEPLGTLDLRPVVDVVE
jgi:hypothetical protein